MKRTDTILRNPGFTGQEYNEARRRELAPAFTLGELIRNDPGINAEFKAAVGRNESFDFLGLAADLSRAHAAQFVKPHQDIAQQNRRAARPPFTVGRFDGSDSVRFLVGNVAGAAIWLEVYYKVEAYGADVGEDGRQEAVAHAHPIHVTLTYQAYQDAPTADIAHEWPWAFVPQAWEKAITGWAITPEDLGWSREELVELVREGEEG